VLTFSKRRASAKEAVFMRRHGLRAARVAPGQQLQGVALASLCPLETVLLPSSAMKRTLFAAACGLALNACATNNALTRLDNGDYRVACSSRLLYCLEPAAKVCGEHGYDVVSAEERRELVGPSPYASETLKSSAVVHCHQPKALFGSEPLAVAGPARPSATPAPRSAPASAPRCVPGTSLACATTAGCHGAQLCAADGASFGPCACDSSPAPATEPGASVPGAPGTPPPPAP
jgi:hypothetical protein